MTKWDVFWGRSVNSTGPILSHKLATDHIVLAAIYRTGTQKPISKSM